MNTRYSVLLFIAVFSFFLSSAQVILPVRQLDTTLLVGATAGNANVSSGGAATYSIPIFVSPGTAGLQPNISIVYNSQVANGVLGAGWNIAGLSAITRVQKDYYHDGTVKAVDLQTDARFEWDGNRLTAINGGSSGTVYATEAESFANIVSSVQQSGTGPLFFTITTKEGMVLTYGTTVDSRIEAPGTSTVLVWRLDQMTDINGNYIRYYYTELSGDSYIDRIEYTGNSTISPVLAPYNVLKFTYEDRPDKSMNYVGGISINQTKRLTGIDMISETVQVRHYSFTYLPVVPTNLGFEKSRLAQVQETGKLNSVTKLLNPTQINWGSETGTQSATTYSNDTTDEISHPLFGDLNGDGRTDELILGKSYIDEYYKHWTYYQSDGNTLVLKSKGYLPNQVRDGFIADINNDGRNEIYLNMPPFKTKNCYLCNQPTLVTTAGESNAGTSGTGLLSDFGLGTQQVIPPSDTCCDSTVYYQDCAMNYYLLNNQLMYGGRENDLDSIGDDNDKFLIGNINSDGKIDHFWVDNDHNMVCSSVRGFTLTTCPNFNSPDKVQLMDIDGDGLDEIFVLNDPAYTIFKYNETSHSFISLVSGTFTGITTSNYKFGDFNGDGKTDIVIRQARINNNKFSVYLSTGTSFSGPLNTPNDAVLDNSTINIETDTESGYYVADLNGDGRDDILNYYDTLATCPAGLVNDGNATLNGSRGFVKYYSKFDGTLVLYGFKKIDDALTNINQVVVNVADIDGDGIKDAVLATYPTQRHMDPNLNNIIYYNYANTQRYRVNTISNGINQAVGFNYVSLAQANNNVYTKGNSSVFPFNDIQPALFVVATVTTHAGYMNGSSYVYSLTNLSYKGARIHLQGRGYMGFDTLVSVNNLSGIKTESCYGINSTYYFRYPLAVNSYVVNVAASTKTFTFTTVSTGNKRYNSYPFQNISSDLLTNTAVTHIYTFDNAGNMLTDIATFGSDAVVTTSNRYIIKGGSGVKNRLSRSFVSSVYTGKPAFTTLKAFTYDTKGNCLSAIDSTNQAKPVTTTYALNTYGLPVSVTVSATGITARTSRTDYDSKYRMPIRSINPLGYKSKRTFNYALGIALTDSAANGLSTTYTYDEFGRLKNTLVPQGYSITQSLTWPKTSNPAGTIFSSTTVTPGKPTVKTYQDILGRAIRTESTGFNNKTLYTDISYLPVPPYGKAGMATSQSLPYYTGETPLPVKYTYDAYGRVTAVDDRGMITQSSYSGKTITTTDVAGRVSAKTVNALGNVISATDNGGSIAYIYNSSGQPSQITAAGAITQISYDVNGRQLTLTDPDAGLTKYTYNAYGELASQTDANNNKDTLIVYDAMGRVIQKTLGGDLTTYVYNNTGRAIGQLASVTGANGAKQEFTYEPSYGWLNTIVQTNPGTNKFTTSYLYDSYGNNTRITYPETGFAVTNTFDKGALVKVNRTSDNSLIWQLNTLSSHGMPTQTTLGNGLTTTYGYDMDQLTNITTGTVQNETYTVNHPNIGNVLSRTDNLTGFSETFTYDNLDRLGRIASPSMPLQNIAYSGNGNITSKTNGGNYYYDATKVHAVNKVEKTNSGTSQPIQQIGYTKFNKASLIQQTTFGTNLPSSYAITYGPDEQRVKTIYIDTVGTKTYRFYAGNYEKDSIVVGSTKTVNKIHYIMGGTGLVAVYIVKSTGQANMYYACTDRQGSITALLNPDKTVAEKYSYDAWGRRRNPTNWNDYNVPAPSLINRGYTGHEHLDGFGLINMNGRMYDPVIGRVLSPDAFVQAPGYTQSYNRYSYCMNNPLRYSDPSGWQILEASLGRNLGVNNDLYIIDFAGNRADNFGYMGWGGRDNNGNGGGGWGGNGGVVPGGSGGYSYNSNTGEYTNAYGDHVTFDQVNMNYIIPNAILNVSGPDAGALVARVREGFSLYSYDFYGRQNIVLSIGDPKVVANTDGDGGYFTSNPTAGSYLYGTLAIGQKGSGVNAGITDNISFIIGLSAEMYKEAASGLNATTSTIASEIQAAKIIGNIGQVAKYTGWAGNGLYLGANYYNAVANRNNNNAEYYQARAIGSTLIVSLNLINFAVPGLGTVLSIGAGIIDANGGFDYFYPVKH